MSFNPSIGLTSVPTQLHCVCPLPHRAVSIPQSGLQAFRQRAQIRACSPHITFQSLNRAYKRSDRDTKMVIISRVVVSIPQSGLQAFRRSRNNVVGENSEWFQSLNRAYKRSDASSYYFPLSYHLVSIPQSGLQAFRRLQALPMV